MARELTQEELRHLRVAGEWGLLRDLAGMRVCMTGAMSLKREQLAVLVEAAGGVFTNTMTASVDLLVVNELSRMSAKVREAERRGVLIVAETELAERLLPRPEELLGGVRTRAFPPAVR